MVIWIDVTEMEEEFSQNLWKLEMVKHAHIDYATNAIHAWYENKEVILFRFGKMGWVNDNRSNSYDLTVGKAGITMKITQNK